MTNDEFEGMLLSALHGPNAAKIASVVLEATLNMFESLPQEQQDRLVEMFLGSLFDLEERVTDLEIVVHANAKVASTRTDGDSLPQIMALSQVKLASLQKIRDSLSSQMKESEKARKLRVMLMLD